MKETPNFGRIEEGLDNWCLVWLEKLGLVAAGKHQLSMRKSYKKHQMKGFLGRREKVMGVDGSKCGKTKVWERFYCNSS